MYMELILYLKAADHGEVLVDILVVFQLVHIDLVRAHAPYKISVNLTVVFIRTKFHRGNPLCRNTKNTKTCE
jgi:hypothetical protein